MQTLEKIIIRLEEAPANIFHFESLDVDQKYFDKKEMIALLNLFENKNESEIKLILNIASEIFNTYNSK